MDGYILEKWDRYVGVDADIKNIRSFIDSYTKFGLEKIVDDFETYICPISDIKISSYDPELPNGLHPMLNREIESLISEYKKEDLLINLKIKDIINITN